MMVCWHGMASEPGCYIGLRAAGEWGGLGLGAYSLKAYRRADSRVLVVASRNLPWAGERNVCHVQSGARLLGLRTVGCNANEWNGTKGVGRRWLTLLPRGGQIRCGRCRPFSPARPYRRERAAGDSVELQTLFGEMGKAVGSVVAAA